MNELKNKAGFRICVNVNFVLLHGEQTQIVKSKLLIQWNLDLKKPDLRKNLDLRKIVDTTDFLVQKLFDLRNIF